MRKGGSGSEAPQSSQICLEQRLPAGPLVAIVASSFSSLLRWASALRIPAVVTSLVVEQASNPSIERTPSGRLRLPTGTAHVER